MQITSSIEPVSVLDQIVAAPGRHRHPLTAPRAAAAFDGMTPLWTRHTVGAIEADRDRRLEHRAHAPIRYRTPRAETVVVHGDFAGGRWADDGGSFEHDRLSRPPELAPPGDVAAPEAHGFLPAVVTSR